jgi:TPR repeat protein
MFKKFSLITTALLLSISVPALSSEAQKNNGKKDASQERRKESVTPSSTKRTKVIAGEATVELSGLPKSAMENAKSAPTSPKTPQLASKKRDREAQGALRVSSDLAGSPDESALKRINPDGANVAQRITSATVSEEDVSRYARHARKGDAEALKELTKCAEDLNMSSAQFHVGMICYDTNMRLQAAGDPSFDPKFTRAKKWLLWATTKNHPAALNMVGIINLLVRHDDDACQYFSLSISADDNEQAHFNLGHMYHEGRIGSTINMEKALRHYTKSAHKNYLPAIYELAQIKLKQADNIDLNLEGLALLKKAAKLYPKSYEEEPELDARLRKNARAELPKVLYQFAMRYLNGTDSFPVDKNQALELLKKASGTYMEAMFELGRLLISPELSAESFKPAEARLLAASKQGHAEAKKLLEDTRQKVTEADERRAQEELDKLLKESEKRLIQRNLDEANSLFHTASTPEEYTRGIGLYESLNNTAHQDYAQQQIMTMHFEIAKKFAAIQIAGFPQDLEKALEHLNLAIQMGHPQAENLLVELQFDTASWHMKSGVAHDQTNKRIVELLTTSADKGHAGAKVELAKIYTKGSYSTARDLPQAFSKLMELCHDERPEIRKLSIEPMLALGNFYWSSPAASNHRYKAIQCFTEIALLSTDAAKKLASCHLEMGRYFLAGTGGLKKDASRAFSHLTEANKLGGVEAPVLLSKARMAMAEQILKTEELTIENLEKVVQWLTGIEEASDKLAHAQYLLGMRFLEEMNLTLIDSESSSLAKKGVEALTASANKKRADAQYQLGLIYMQGNLAVNKSPGMALQLIESSAGQSHALAVNLLPEAQFNQAMGYLGGRNDMSASQRTPDYGQAIPLLEASVAGGFAGAKGNLAEVYFDYGQTFCTDSGKRNFKRAMNWFEKSAHMGLVKAQLRVGMTYYRGENSIPEDLPAALKWLQLAAAQKNAEAIKVLPAVKIKLAEQYVSTAGNNYEQLRTALGLLADVLGNHNAKNLHKLAGEVKAKVQMDFARIALASKEHDKILEADPMLREVFQKNLNAHQLLLDVQYQLALNFMGGLKGAVCDKARAFKLLEPLAISFHEGARRILVDVYLQDNNVSKLPLAVGWLENFAKTDPSVREALAIAQNRLGGIYLKGSPVIKRSPDLAKDMFRKAAEFGLADAQYNYAALLEKSDPKNAALWYKKAHVQGHGSATYALAVLHDQSGETQNALKSLQFAMLSDHPNADALIRKYATINKKPVLARREIGQARIRIDGLELNDELGFDSMNQFLSQLKQLAQLLKKGPVNTSLIGLSSQAINDIRTHGTVSHLHVHMMHGGKNLLTLTEELASQVRPMYRLLQDKVDMDIKDRSATELATVLLAKTQMNVAAAMGFDGKFIESLKEAAKFRFPEVNNLGFAKLWLNKLTPGYVKALEQLETEKAGFQKWFHGEDDEKQKMLNLYQKTAAKLEEGRRWSEATSHLLGYAKRDIDSLNQDSSERDEACKTIPSYARVIKAFENKDEVGM